MTKIALILPGLSSGGLERVMTELAEIFSEKHKVKVHVIALTGGNQFYKIADKAVFHKPAFDHKKYHRLLFTIKIFCFLRKTLKQIKPDSLLSFGGKYNAFVLLASSGLNIHRYVSDRSRPNISYGRFLDWLNPLLYRKATGIVAQTDKAKQIMFQRTRHQNIQVIGNPIRRMNPVDKPKENIILNVGRFIGSKHQDLLIEYFATIKQEDWRLVFLGDGPHLPAVRRKAKELGVIDQVEFPGVVEDVDSYYSKSKIFGFTSTSEGFPNALGEAMAAGCACISFDCLAGPADLIDDGMNGVLVPEMDHDQYSEKLKILMQDSNLCESFGTAAKKKMEQFDRATIAEAYFNFITGN